MSEFDRNQLERIISDLDEKGALFPQYGLTKENNGLKLLGGGGFSTVYEMYDRERPELRYALKVTGFNRHVLSAEQFWETVRIQQALCRDSDYIVRIVDAKELTEQGVSLRLVLMERLEGIIVKDRFHRVTLGRTELAEEAEVVKFAMEIGEAVRAAHDCRVLHRDIKLENIFWDDDDQRYKLGDFGVARYTEDGDAETCIYTNGYGAPEIERGILDSYNVTADIYSLGITCYLLLNELKFPGSEGYYSKTEVQYDPDYIFPAPARASVEMTRLIRRMCSYRPEDRCQSMEEVLAELVKVGRADGVPAAEEPADQIDLVTETYRGERAAAEEDVILQDFERMWNHPRTRAERQEKKKLTDEIYREESIKYFAIITVLLTLLLTAVQPDAPLAGSWALWALPAAVLFEALLQRVGEFHILWGAVTVGLAGISVYQDGLVAAHIVLLLAVLIGCPVLTASGALASGIWIALSVALKLPVLGLPAEYDLCWIALLATLLAVNRYFDMRIIWEKTTPVRMWLGKLLYAGIFLVMIAASAVLWLLQKVDVMTVPEAVRCLHLTRTGVLGYIAMIIFTWWDGSPEEENDGEAEAAEDEYLDE